MISSPTMYRNGYLSNLSYFFLQKQKVPPGQSQSQNIVAKKGNSPHRNIDRFLMEARPLALARELRANL